MVRHEKLFTLKELKRAGSLRQIQCLGSTGCNAFNTVRWTICIEAMVRKKVPDYLLRMIDDYLSDRWVINEGDKWSSSKR